MFQIMKKKKENEKVSIALQAARNMEEVKRVEDMIDKLNIELTGRNQILLAEAKFQLSK
jgi:hypothetical protein